MSDSPYRDVPPNRWTGLYNAARAIDDTLTGIGATMFLLGSRGLLWAAQAAADARLVRAEERSARRSKQISAYLDGLHLGELPDEWDQP